MQLRWVGAVAVAIGCSSAAAAPPAKSEVWWQLVALSSDGAHVLATESRGPQGAPTVLHWRVFAVDTGKVEADLELRALAALVSTETSNEDETSDGGLKIESPALADELRRLGPVLAKFPLGAAVAHGIAASADGRRVVFSVGDWLFTAVDGKPVARVPGVPTYAPRFAPDGKTFVYNRIGGRLDKDTARYDLYVATVGAKAAPRRIDGASETGRAFAVTPAGAMRVVSTHEPEIKTCVVDVGLVAPYRTKKLTCLPGGERVFDCVMSPKGMWIACVTMKDSPDGKTTIRIRTMEVATGKVAFDDNTNLGLVAGISDDGLMVLDLRNGELGYVDSRGTIRKVKQAARIGLYVFFLDNHRFVGVADGKPIVIDTAKP